MSSNSSFTGKCIIFSAPSGAGKTTIVRHLLEELPSLEFSISATSRAPRKIEREGKDYHYLSVAEFLEKVEQNAFIEWEEVYKDQYYGTLKSEIERIWEEGKHVIFDVDVDGGINLKRYFGEQALAVFVQPPSIEHLRKRLEGRSTETPESIERRIGKADYELGQAKHFDKVLVNDVLDVAKVDAMVMVKDFLEK
ncbi:MAG: guanylate kinase [Flavobacteriales bacterium]|nr:guanylate kinase [Flavobacteriales bacterium]